MSGKTDNEQKRHYLTNDVLAGLLSVGGILLLLGSGTGDLDLATIPQPALYGFLLLWGISVIWAFGEAAAKTVADVVSELR